MTWFLCSSLAPKPFVQDWYMAHIIRCPVMAGCTRSKSPLQAEHSLLTYLQKLSKNTGGAHIVFGCRSAFQCVFRTPSPSLQRPQGGCHSGALRPHVGCSTPLWGTRGCCWALSKSWDYLSLKISLREPSEPWRSLLFPTPTCFLPVLLPRPLVWHPATLMAGSPALSGLRAPVLGKRPPSQGFVPGVKNRRPPCMPHISFWLRWSIRERMAS